MSKKKVIKARSSRMVVEAYEFPTVEDANSPASSAAASAGLAGLGLEGLGSPDSGELNFDITQATDMQPAMGGVVDPEIIASAEREAEQMRTEAHNIIADAKARAETVIDEAREQGYQEGMEQASAIAREELAPVMMQLIETHEKVSDIKNVILKQNEEEIINLALDIARKVLDAELTYKPALVGNIIKKALERIDLTEDVTVKVNPDDYEVLMHNLPEELKRVWLVADSKIPKGGALVDAETGTFDARVETQMVQIEQNLKKDLVE